MGAERRGRAGSMRADADLGKGAHRMRAPRSGVRLWRAAWRRGTAVALSCILAAGLVPVASFAQGSETVAAARESLRANASDAADGGTGSADTTDGYAVGNAVGAGNDGAGGAADAGYAAADSADGGVLVVGSEVMAGGEESAAAQGSQGSQNGQNLQGAQAAAGTASSAAGDVAGAGNAFEWA